MLKGRRINKDYKGMQGLETKLAFVFFPRLALLGYRYSSKSPLRVPISGGGIVAGRSRSLDSKTVNWGIKAGVSNDDTRGSR